MKCRYVERNQEEHKCSDYYESHGTKQGVYCRLAEWKRKRAICPYNRHIISKCMKKKKGDMWLAKAIVKSQELVLKDNK